MSLDNCVEEAEMDKSELFYQDLLEDSFEAMEYQGSREQFRKEMLDPAINAVHELANRRNPSDISLDYAFRLGFVRSMGACGVEMTEITPYGKDVYVALKGDELKQNENSFL